MDDRICYNPGVPAQRCARRESVTSSPIETGPKLIDQRALPDGAPIAEGLAPREVNDLGGVEVDLLPDLRSETPEDKPPPAKTRTGAEAEQIFSKARQDAQYLLANGVFCSRSVLPYIKHVLTGG